MTKRGKAVIKKDFITKDIYNFYKESNDNPVPYETFRYLVKINLSFYVHRVDR